MAGVFRGIANQKGQTCQHTRKPRVSGEQKQAKTRERGGKGDERGLGRKGRERGADALGKYSITTISERKANPITSVTDNLQLASLKL